MCLKPLPPYFRSWALEISLTVWTNCCSPPAYQWSTEGSRLESHTTVGGFWAGCYCVSADRQNQPQMYRPQCQWMLNWFMVRVTLCMGVLAAIGMIFFSLNMTVFLPVIVFVKPQISFKGKLVRLHNLVLSTGVETSKLNISFRPFSNSRLYWEKTEEK